MKISTMLLAVAAATLLAAAPARAQDEWLREIVVRLDSVTAALAGEGLSPVGEQHAARLREWDSQEFDLRLAAGSYRMVGVCDSECLDLDLVLTRGGREVDNGVAVVDATPVLTFQLREAASLTVRVIMDACGMPVCGWGVGIYRVGG